MRMLLVVWVMVAGIVMAPIAAANSADDLAWLNAQRASASIPGDLVEQPDWTAKCDRHISYMQQTNYFGHPEDPANPLYTEEGNWGGTNSVLAHGATWMSARNPFEDAPLHLIQMLTPRLSQVGLADRDGYICMTTWPGYLRTIPTSTSVLVYPGEGAVLAPAQTTNELPFTPAQKLGLVNPTGPHLYVYDWGPSLAGSNAYTVGVKAASLTGPTGPVDLRVVDRRHTELGGYLPPGAALLIPAAPLQEGATYTASVEFTDGAARQWSFATHPALAPSTISATIVRRGKARRLCTQFAVGGGCRKAYMVRRYRFRVIGTVSPAAANAKASVVAKSGDVWCTRSTDNIGRFSCRFAADLRARAKNYQLRLIVDGGEVATTTMSLRSPQSAAGR